MLFVIYKICSCLACMLTLTWYSKPHWVGSNCKIAWWEDLCNITLWKHYQTCKEVVLCCLHSKRKFGMHITTSTAAIVCLWVSSYLSPTFNKFSWKLNKICIHIRTDSIDASIHWLDRPPEDLKSLLWTATPTLAPGSLWWGLSVWTQQLVVLKTLCYCSRTSQWAPATAAQHYCSPPWSVGTETITLNVSFSCNMCLSTTQRPSRLVVNAFTTNNSHKWNVHRSRQTYVDKTKLKTIIFQF